MNKDWIRKEDAIGYVLRNHYDEIKELIFEQEAENLRE